jgi:hypothetical protein
MKRISGFLLAIIVMTAFLSCEAPLKVTSDYDRSVAFSNYSTFEVITLQGERQTLSQLNADRIVEAVRAEMVAKGFKESTDAADLKVNAVAIMKEKQEVTANTNYYGYGGVYRPYGWGGGGGYTTVDVDEYTDGSLIIEVIDAKTGKLIWEGVGNKRIDAPSKNPNEAIPEAVKTIMAGFPPGKSGKSKK